MDTPSRTDSPGPSESVLSQEDAEDALTQLEGDFGPSSDLRARLQRVPSTTSTAGAPPLDLSRLNLVSLTRPWNDPSERTSFHAISTVLSHPTKKPAPLRASRIPLPPAPPSEVFPKVNRRELDNYVKAITPEWERFTRVRSGSGADDDDMDGGMRLPLVVEDPRDLPSLDQVPEVFFERDFDLGNPHTFELVTQVAGGPPAPPSSTAKSALQAGADAGSVPSSPLPTLNPLVDPTALDGGTGTVAAAQPLTPVTAVPPPMPRSNKTQPSVNGGGEHAFLSSAHLQERLASHLDVVEQHLVHEISRRSSSFFAALTNLQELERESSSCLARIASLRGELSALDEGQAKRGIEVGRLLRELRSLKRVEGAVRDIRGVEEAVGTIRALIAEGDGFGAVGLWEEVDGWVKRKGKGKEKEVTPAAVETKLAANGHAGSRRSPMPSPRASPRFATSSLTDVAELPETDEAGAASAASTSRSRSGSLAIPHHQPPLNRNSSSSSSLGPSDPRFKAQKSQPSLPPPVDLTSLAALAHLPQTLTALGFAIATQLEAQLQQLLSSELTSLLSNSDDGNSANPDGEDSRNDLRDRLVPLVLGLVRVHGSNRLVGVLREVGLAEVRETVKRCLPLKEGEDVGDDFPRLPPSGPGSSSVAGRTTASPLVKTLKEMEHTEFLVIEKSMLGGLLGTARAVGTLSKALESIVNEAAITPIEGSTTIASPTPSSPLLSLAAELAEVLSTTTELAHARASKIIGLRTERHASLALTDFLAVFSEAWTFVISCEVLCRKMIVGLRGTMVVQAKTFLSTYHSQRVSASARLVETELWSPEDPNAAQQHAVDLMVAAAMSDPAELIAPFTAAMSSSQEDVIEKGKLLRVENNSFFVVGATLGSLELLVDYLKIVVNVELLTTDAMAKIIEYLKSFNSRTCQVVLGAGAMRSAGLKNITAKHLALASQSLSAVMALIPYVRETLRRHLSSKQAVMLVEFDRLKRDYHEHQNEIHAKLVAIMADRLAIHMKGLREIDWEATPTRAAGKPNEYIEFLAKETTQLHKILSKYLPDAVVDSITSQVFAAITHALSSHFTLLELKSEDAKQRLLQDVTFLSDRLGALPNVSPFPSGLVTLVSDKTVPKAKTRSMRSMSGLLRRVSSSGSDVIKPEDQPIEVTTTGESDMLAPSNASAPPTTSASIDHDQPPQGAVLSEMPEKIPLPVSATPSPLSSPAKELSDPTASASGNGVAEVANPPLPASSPDPLGTLPPLPPSQPASPPPREEGAGSPPLPELPPKDDEETAVVGDVMPPTTAAVLEPQEVETPANTEAKEEPAGPEDEQTEGKEEEKGETKDEGEPVSQSG